ncbi:MAG: DNA polymerase IV [Xanthomonadales bacterium]|nr:DNA polymerase IV [Xanthomonadales bacterium]
MSDPELRAVIHVDMDAFYASVECLDDPSLRGLPLIVGGLGPRGVVATASYEARVYGVHSAMPMAQARRLCPQARFVKPRMTRYGEKSAEVFGIFRDFTPLVEGLSLDEAFLDVSGSLRLFGGHVAIGQRIKQRIATETGLSASVGLAHNKFLAKLASEAQKPDGFLQVPADGARAFLDPMPVTRLWGIGKRTAPRLRALGVLTIGQLRRVDVSVLQTALGKRAEHFQRLARGEDSREVTPARADKSISHEVTFDANVLDRTELLAELQRQVEKVAARLRAREQMATTVVVKVRDACFQTVTRSRSMPACSNSTRTLYRLARALLEAWREDHQGTPVRLLGMGVTGIEGNAAKCRVSDSMRENASTNGASERIGEQLDSQDERGIDRVFDRIKHRFGSAGIAHAQTLRRKKD